MSTPMPDERAVRCGNCGVPNSGDARYCGNCGRQLPTVSSAPAGETGLSDRCGHCGAAAAPGVAVCSHCGSSTQAPRLGQPEELPSSFRGRTGDGAGGRSLPSRGLAELVAETLRLYRQGGLLFAGLGLLPQLPGLAALAAPGLAADLILAFFGLVLVAVSQGAAVYAVVGYYLGSPVSLADCLGQARPKALALVTCLIILAVLSVSASLLIAVLIGIPLLFLALVLLWFYPQGIMLEGLGPISAFRRSSNLVHGNWWRVFGIGLSFVLPVAVALLIVVAVLGQPTGAVTDTIVYALVSAVALPWVMIGSTLLYLDLRVRKEALSLDALRLELPAR